MARWRREIIRYFSWRYAIYVYYISKLCSYLLRCSCNFQKLWHREPQIIAHKCTIMEHTMNHSITTTHPARTNTSKVRAQHDSRISQPFLEESGSIMPQMGIAMPPFLNYEGCRATHYKDNWPTTPSGLDIFDLVRGDHVSHDSVSNRVYNSPHTTTISASVVFVLQHWGNLPL